MRGRTSTAIAAIGLSATLACGGEAAVRRSMAAAVARGPGTRLVLAEHAPFGWDKVCVLGPYTSDDRVDAITGLQGAARQAHDIGSSDAINLLMFIDDGRIVASIAHPRRQGDFGPELTGKCYTRESASFIVRVPPPGKWRTIGSR